MQIDSTSIDVKVKEKDEVNEKDEGVAEVQQARKRIMVRHIGKKSYGRPARLLELQSSRESKK